MYATVLMDVEDLIAPEADDIAMTCAEILSEEGIEATFCVVGEKARLLQKRGRHEVIAAVKRHDIGVHTDFHSVHPTILEYLQDKNWDDGVAEALRREAPGVRAIQDVFGIMPSCWGGPGNTWGPPLNAALRELGVSAFVYAYTTAPDRNAHRFAGILAYPDGRHVSDTTYQDDALATQYRDRLCNDLAFDSAQGMFWQQIFIGHPTRILHEEFWDAPNFAGGANPPSGEWRPARRKSPSDLVRALDNFRRAARTIKALPNIELRTIRQMNELIEPLASRPLTPTEQDTMWPITKQKLQGMAGWPILPSNFDLTSVLTMTRNLMPNLERFTFPSLHAPSSVTSEA